MKPSQHVFKVILCPWKQILFSFHAAEDEIENNLFEVALCEGSHCHDSVLSTDIAELTQLQRARESNTLIIRNCYTVFKKNVNYSTLSSAQTWIELITAVVYI